MDLKRGIINPDNAACLLERLGVYIALGIPKQFLGILAKNLVDRIALNNRLHVLCCMARGRHNWFSKGVFAGKDTMNLRL